jgi:NAD(P)-dependent dehydrogenase (short-subunit alcohol dehydrogenase family)
MVWLDVELGGLDVLVNNARVLRSGALGSSDVDAASQEEVQVNLYGSLRMTRLALPLRRSDEEAVVFVSSAVALVAAPGLAVYAATKAALHSLARSLRRKLV